MAERELRGRHFVQSPHRASRHGQHGICRMCVVMIYASGTLLALSARASLASRLHSNSIRL